MTSPKFDGLFEGPARRPSDPVTQRDMDLAASIQKVTEEIMLRTALHVHKATGMKHLCLAGGVALNCVGNGKILREGPFDGHLDSAGSWRRRGRPRCRALFVWHQLLETPAYSPRERQPARFVARPRVQRRCDSAAAEPVKRDLLTH
jgi:carbamoyltransferase